MLEEVVPILTNLCIFHSPLIDLDPSTQFAQVKLKVAFIFSPGEKKVSDTGDEAVMKIHKKIKIAMYWKYGIFSAITSKV